MIRTATIATAIAIASLLGGCGESGNGSPQGPWTTGPARVVLTSEPAESFAPLVVLHARETRFPIGAAKFIESSTFKWLLGKCLSYENVAVGDIARVKAPGNPPPVDPSRMGDRNPYRHAAVGRACRGKGRGPQFAANRPTRPFDPSDRPAGLPLDQGFYLELLTAAGPGERTLSKVGEHRFVGPVPAYVEQTATRVEGAPALRLTYWLLYGQNRPPKGAPGRQHEGDWERVGVLLRREGPRRYMPISLRLYSNERTVDVPWRSVQRVPERSPGAASHPVAFAALGTHTLYPRPGTHDARAKAIFEIDTGKERTADCAACPRWRTWTRIEDASDQPWYGFGGAWGATYGDADAQPFTIAPLGPSRYARERISVE